MLEIIRSPKVYDVCVVGSGAAGGIAAKLLTENGLKVAMLEAGPPLDPEKDFKEHVWPYELAHRGAGPAGLAYNNLYWTEFLAPNGSWAIEGEPYTSAPGSTFRWFRSRIVGGRTNHWGRVALRFGERDFKGRSSDGAGEDWALNYQDLASYYDKIESYIGVFGSKENIPNAPDGIFLPPPRPRCTELLIKKGCDQLGIHCVPSRLAIITQPLNGRAPCHYCAQCYRGCRTASNFSSSQVLIPPAIATGRLTLITNAMAREVLVDKDGKATAVSYVDKRTRAEQKVRAKAFVIAASACESARLLLNSTSRLFPDGLANSSGLVGRNLMDSVDSDGDGYFPQLERMPPHNHDGIGGMHMYMPWWKYNRRNDFLRGYQIQFYGGRTMPSVGNFHGICQRAEGYGIPLKQKCRQTYGTVLNFQGLGEMIPNENTYCEIDPNVMDKWGIPVLRFHFKWGENEIKMAKDMQETFREIVEAAGGTYLTRTEASGERPFGLHYGGEVVHEVGTTRMGASRKTSVLNGFCQAHDVRNLFVTDGGCFTSQPEKNPTLTILALSWRASEYLLDEARKGNL